MEFIGSLLISVLTFSGIVVLNVQSGRLKENKMVLLGMIVSSVVLGEVCGFLHEAAHVVVANAFGLEVTRWGANVGIGAYVWIPLISESSPLAQTAVSLAGPLVSLIVVCFAWLALNRSTSTKKNLVLAHFVLTQGLGGFGPLLYLFSGDATNFAQGLSRLTLIRLEVIGVGLLYASIIWTIVVLRKTLGYMR